MAKTKARRGRTKGRHFRTLKGFYRYENPVALSKCGVIIGCLAQVIPAKKIFFSHPAHYSKGHEFTILREKEFTVAVLKTLKKTGYLKELRARKKNGKQN